MSYIQFSDEELKLLITDERNCVKLQKGVKHIGIHPFYLNDIANGIADNLNKIVSKYDKTLKGIILAYKKPRLLQCNGIIHNDKGPIYVDVEAEFYIFCPQEDSLVKAIVNKTGQEHIGCLTHKAFNISVPKPVNEVNWKGKSIKTGDEILIKINYVDMFYIIPYIKGEIVDILKKSIKKEIEEDSGISTNESLHKYKKKSKSNKHNAFISSNDNNEPVIANGQLNLSHIRINTEINIKPKKNTSNLSDVENVIIKKESSDSINVGTLSNYAKLSSKERRNTIHEFKESEIVNKQLNLSGIQLDRENNKKSKKGTLYLSDMENVEIKKENIDNINVETVSNNAKLKSKRRRNSVHECKESSIVNKQLNSLDNEVEDRDVIKKQKKSALNLSNVENVAIKKENTDDMYVGTLSKYVKSKLKGRRNTIHEMIPADHDVIEDKNTIVKLSTEVFNASNSKTYDDVLPKSKKSKTKKRINEDNEEVGKSLKKYKPTSKIGNNNSSTIETSEEKITSKNNLDDKSLKKVHKKLNDSVQLKSNPKSDDNKCNDGSLKKIKSRRNTVSQIIPADNILKKQKKKSKTLNRSLDDAELVYSKKDNSCDKDISQKSKKKRKTLSEIDDIQAMKNKLLESVLKEMSPKKKKKNTEMNKSYSEESNKKKEKRQSSDNGDSLKKHQLNGLSLKKSKIRADSSIETEINSENDTELSLKKHTISDDKESGFKKKKLKQKTSGSPNSKYPSLQIDTPHYTDYVPTNEVSTFHDSISPIKMKDRPNLSSPETKKYTSPVGSDSNSSRKKSRKPSALLSDFHTDLIAKYFKK